MKSSGSTALKIFAWLTVFAVAMGFLEAIVVVYMRQIYYPSGFDFPLSMLSPEMLSVEWIREIATIVMLAAIGIIAGKNNLQRLLYFLFSFAIWDIFYYVALRLLLDWPASLLTWDILFLIPVPWIGPVLAPVICSLTMIFMALSLTGHQEKGYDVRIKLYEWVLIYLGAFIIFCTYIWDYSVIIIRSGILTGSRTPSGAEQFWQMITQYEPQYYNWIIFGTGEILILISMILILTRIKLKTQ